MRKKGLYLIVGFVWAVLLGVGAGLGAAAVAAGVAWIYLFGDSPWPDWTNWAIPGIGLVVGLSTFAILMAVTRMVASGSAGRDDGQSYGKGSSAVAWALLFVGLAVAIGFVWQQYARNAGIERAREQAAAATRYLPVLLAETHQISNIVIDWPGGDRDGRATVTLDGQRSGRYRLDWQVHDRAYEKSLLGSDMSLQLAAGMRVIDVTLPVQGIVDGYRTLLTSTDANVMVDEPFVFEVQLTPILSSGEESLMSPHDIQNLANGWSPLIRRSSAEFPVRFFLRGGALAWQ